MRTQGQACNPQRPLPKLSSLLSPVHWTLKPHVGSAPRTCLWNVIGIPEAIPKPFSGHPPITRRWGATSGMRLTGKERILLYLLEVSRLDEGIEVPPEFTQEGVAWGATLDRRHLPQYIHPLLREGLVRERRAHVRGVPQRPKMYGPTQTRQLACPHLPKPGLG